MDSSAVEYVDKDGNTISVQQALDNTVTDNSTHKTVVFGDDINMGRYLLLAKITDAIWTTNNIIKFSCPNFKGQGDGFNYEDAMDILKFELHFNTGSRDTINDYGVTLKQHGLVLYSYPLNNPQNTAPRIEEAVRLYWDYSKGEIYVFLVDMEVAIPHCVLEYTGSGTLLEENTFVGDTYLNWNDGLNGTWEASKWKSIPYNKLETPPIYELGGNGGSTGGTTTFTSLADLELTTPVSVGEIFNAMPSKTMAVLSCEAKDESDGTVTISDIPMSFGVLTIKKNEVGRFSIEYQNSLNSSPCNVKRWIGTLKGADGTGLYWKLVSTQTTYTALSDMGLTADATVQDVIDALPVGDTALLRTDGFTNWSTLFNGIQYGYLKVEKTVNALSNIELQNVVEPNYRYFGAQSGGKFSKWIQTSSKVTAAFNSKTFKIDITKGKESWNGNMKFGYFVDNSYGEIIISSLGTTNVTWSCSESVRYVKSVTYTIDPDNKAHVTIGVELYDIVYGIHLLETAGDFATINSFTGDVFTGTSVALRRGVRGRNNGVGILCEVEDLGLTFPCTTVQIAQAMRTLANSATRTPTSGVIGIFNCGGKASTITDAPSDYGLLHVETYGYDRILIRFEGISGSSYVGSWIGQIKSSGGTFSGITWEEIYIETEAKKEENSYIPDMYDRNSNGDIPVVGFDRLASSMCLIQNTNLLNNGDTYDEDYVGGWVYTMANDILIKDKEMFNKIKVVVSIPGVLRIGIVNDKIFEANPRYSTCLDKWLVADFVAFTGLKEYDIDDTILEEGQYIFIECRQGESSWYYNQGSTAVTQGNVTYPASSCTSGLNVADKLDSTTNNVVFKSQSVTSKSAIFTFSSEYNVGNKLRTNFLARGYDNTARTDMSDVKSYNQSLFKGGLNVGLYRRTKYSDTRVCKCIENAMNNSWVGDDSVTKIYATYGQEKLVGKSVYAFKLDVRTPGNLTIYHLKGKSLDTIQVVDKYTHYVRAKGLQTIHLPFDIKINSTDEYIGFGGLHYKSTSSNIVRHSCLWHYLAGDQVTGSCGWMNTIGEVGFYSIGVSMTSYPETFTSFETNGSYLNIELICRGEKRSPLEDKYISFTGDSITTFANFCTKQADMPAGNSAGDNAVYYPASGRTVNNVDATWWGILAKDNRMQILRNDAWSGSRVSSTTGSTDTKCLCGTERYKFLENSSQGTNVTFPYGEPEIIVNMIGTNDLSGNVELGEGILYGLSSPTEDDYKKIYSAYSLMCQRFATYYNRHGGKVVHFIIPRGTGLNTYANSNGDSIQKIALEFEKIAKSWGHYFIPLSYFTGFNMNQYKNLTCPTSNVLRDFRSSYFNGSDGLHPNVIGMETIADGVHRFLCSIM